MIIETGRFGRLEVKPEDVIRFPQGIFGFQEERTFCVIDPGDETLILWLQSIKNPFVSFPILEPKVFRPTYSAELSALDLRELQLLELKGAAVYSILTIPEDVTQMTANLKAPIILNLKEKIGKQVVLQENEYSIQHAMFKELRSHLITIAHQKSQAAQSAEEHIAISIRPEMLPTSTSLRSHSAP